MRLRYIATFVVVLALAGACAKKQPPVARPTQPPPATVPADTTAARPPAPPEPVAEPITVPEDPSLTSGDLSARTVDEINKESPFQPVFFELDQDQLDSTDQTVLQANAEILRTYPAWTVTIEGHADKRGTPEYNLALGERRALAVRDYLVSLGIDPGRLRTVSYGNEFPFDPGDTEEAYALNRRAHFVVTAK